MDHPLMVVETSGIDTPEIFARFCQQKLGTPYPNIKDMIALKRNLNAFFKEYPDLDYHVLCRVVDWCKSKRKRPANVGTVLKLVRYAWADGAVHDLDPAQRRVLVGMK